MFSHAWGRAASTVHCCVLMTETMYNIIVSRSTTIDHVLRKVLLEGFFRRALLRSWDTFVAHCFFSALDMRIMYVQSWHDGITG